MHHHIQQNDQGNDWSVQLGNTFARGLLTRLVDYYFFAPMGHALSNQYFTSYENVRKWLDDWFASKERQFFFGVAPTNCQIGGKNV